MASPSDSDDTATRSSGRAKVRWHSVSSTREYEGCPRRYRFGYVEKRPKDRPVPPTWRFGTVVHAALEAAWKSAMDAESNVPIAAHLGVALTALDEAIVREGLEDEDRRRGIRIVTRALDEDVVRNGVLDPDVELPPSRPIGVEEALRGRIDAQHRIIGFVDLVLERPDGVIELVDHKVTSHRSGEEELREDFQLNLYGRLAARRWPEAAAIIGTHHYPTGPAAVSVVLDPTSMRRAEERVFAAARDIAQDTTFTPTPSANCHHCPWQPSCDEGTAWVTDHPVA